MATHPMPPGSWSDNEINPLLSDDAFQNEYSRRLFDAIDKLRGCGANQDIDLPELVIVGDQSAGKSSLLQSLTDIPFPVASNVCTRFPTRIISRRAPGQRETTTISIEPRTLSVFRSGNFEVRRSRYDAFKRTIPEMTKGDFLKVIEEASDAMGIERLGPEEPALPTTDQTGDCNFSDDVLKIEIAGPDRSYFSILDVPGIFQSLTRQLTKKDKSGVDAMVSNYLFSRQSIVICVASGTNDPANQAIFDVVSQHDKDGERTVGVITKCDVTQHKDLVMDLAKNREKHFQHGWFVVRNRTPSEVEADVGPLERFTREQAFFNTQPWITLPYERRGTRALKTYLAELLCTRIEKTFPTFLRDIQTRQSVTASELSALGVVRTTMEQKRTYLTRIAHDFHNLATQSLHGRYDHVATNDMKLRMKIRDANDAFTREMTTHGHSVEFARQSLAFEDRAANNAEQAANKAEQTPTARARKGVEVRLPGSGQDAASDGDMGTTKPRIVAMPALADSTPNQVRPFCPTTADLDFVALQARDDSGTVFWQSIPFIELYKGYSFEELRLSDYTQSQPSPLLPKYHAPNPSGTSRFGTPNWDSSNPPSQAPSTGGGLFGMGNINPEKPPPQAPSTGRGLFGGFVQGKESTKKTSAFEFRTPAPSTPLDSTSSQTTSIGRSGDIYQWIQEEIKTSRGTELQGTLNPDVLPILFHKQAKNWRALSETHFINVRVTSLTALRRILGTVCKDMSTYEKINLRIVQANDYHGKEQGLRQLSHRVSNILSSHLQTNNPAFEQKVSDARKLRFHAALERYRASRPSSSLNAGTATNENQILIDMRDTGALFAELHMSNSQNLEDEIHDTLRAYYEIARDDFVEFVNQLVVEPYLNDPEGPVLFFSPVYVAGLKDEEIEALAAEDEKTMLKRKSLEETLARLNQAEKIAREYHRD